MAQKVNLTIQSNTACDLFHSCNRISFVSSVSAMSTPAGFINFQGHNAVNDAFQVIDCQFSYNLNDSLYFSDKNKQTQPERAALDSCNHTQKAGQLHGFDVMLFLIQFLKNCSCNNCEYSCSNDDGFKYYDSGVFEGFDGYFVLGVWSGVIVIAAIVTIYRNKSMK